VLYADQGSANHIAKDQKHRLSVPAGFLMFYYLRPQILLLFVLTFLINWVSIPQSAYAADLTVNVAGSTADTPAGDGNCTLVDAIQEANTPGTESADCGLGDAGADTIILPGNIVIDGSTLFSDNGSNGLPAITSNITIAGNGFSISRSDATCPSGNNYRHFSVAASGQLTLESTTLRNGCIQGNNGGSIRNAGILTLINSTLDSNTASGTGGAVYNLGTANILNSAITNNTGNLGGGGIANETGTLEIVNSTVNNNSANSVADLDGGAILNNSGTLDIFDSTLRFNSASKHGGAVYSSSGQVNVSASTISDNAASNRPELTGGSGGAFYFTGGQAEIFNSLLNNNRSERQGGAIYARDSAVVDIYNSVLTNNTAYRDDGGAVYNTSQSVLSATYSTFANNEAWDDGGAIRNRDASFEITKSAILNNRAGESGGGIRNDGRLTISDSTIYGNEADVYGGGVFNQGNPNATSIWSWNIVNMNNTTVTQNRSNGGGGGVVNRYYGGEINIANSIVASNSDNWGSSNCMDENNGPPNGNGTWNTIGIGLFNSWSLRCPGFVRDRSLVLGGLANNGGPTQTVAVTTGTPIDSSGTGATSTDQRNVSAQSTRDAGAFESNTVLPLISFASGSSTASEGNSHSVDVILDNTSGNLSSQSMAFYVNVSGTAVSQGIDYTRNSSLPISIPASSWPAPGSTRTVSIDLSILADAQTDPGETIIFEIQQSGLAGPAFLGTITSHTVTISETDVVAPAQIDLALTKTVGVAPGGDADGDGILDPGDTARYTITVTNLGPNDANDVTIEDTLPAELNGSAATVNATLGNYNVANGEWSNDGTGNGNGFALATGTNATLTIDVPVNLGTDGANVTNIARVSTTNPPTETDTDASNDMADATFTVGTSTADLAVNNQVDFAPGGDVNGNGIFDAGDVIRYTVTLTNQGTHAANNIILDVVLSNMLDAGTITPIASVGTYNAATSEWSADGAGTGFSLGVSAVATLSIDAALLGDTSGQTVVNAAGVSVAAPPAEEDPDMSNNAAQNQFTVASNTPRQSRSSRSNRSSIQVFTANAPQIGIFDPAISKLGILLPGETGIQGEQLEWIVTVRNKSAVAGTNVVVTDEIISALRIDKVVINSGNATPTTNGQTVTVTIPSLGPGEVVQFSIFTTVLNGRAPLENTACVTGDNGNVCASSTAVSILPQTGETPWWRSVALYALTMLSLSLFIGAYNVIFVRSQQVTS